MSKSKSQTQGAFSFLDEVEKVEPQPKPRKHVLKPPAQIVIETDDTPSPHIDDTASMNESLPVSQVSDSAEPSLESKHTEVLRAQDDTTELSSADVAKPSEASSTETEAELEEPGEVRKNTRGRKSAKEHSIAASMVEIPEDEVLFSKQYYSMGEVTAMFKESHSLIRYWESEFDILKPRKNGKGDRFFRPVDIKNLYLIYDLLRRRKFTIEGAREYLKNDKKAENKFAAMQSLQKIKTFLLELKASL